MITGGGVNASTAIWKHHSSMFFRRELILENEIKAPRTRHEDEIFRHKCLYVSQKVTLINKLMFLYRNNPASETHRKQKVENLYGPLLCSWKELIKWHEEKHLEDLEAQVTYKTLFCVYAIEAIGALCETNHKAAEVERIAREHLFLDDVLEYMLLLKDQGLRERIERYVNYPQRFINKRRKYGYKQSMGRMLLKIPGVKKRHYMKKYPTDLRPLELT